MAKVGLYLAGGGARGAFQAGVIKGIYHILKVQNVPFELISGVSAGGGNACILAQNADHFKKATEELEDLWCNIKSNSMFTISKDSDILFLRNRNKIFQFVF